MSNLSQSGQFDDVDNSGYATASVTVTTTQVEAKCGASRLTARQGVTITNRTNTAVYYGPSGVTTTTGELLYKDQQVFLPFGDSVPIFMITAGGSTTVIVQELA